MAEKNILDAIKAGFKDLRQLEIITVVGPVKVETGPEGKIKVSIPEDATTKAMVSRIDLIDGDVRNLIDPAFVTGDLTSLRDFHNDQVKKGNDIIVKNIEAVVELAKKIELV